MKPDPQTMAIQSDATQLAVIACAGSGKTTTLINRVASKIQNKQANAACVTVITFTVKAAEEIRLRLGEAIADKQALSEIYVGTIHGFCRHVLTSFLPRDFETLEVLSEVQQLALLSARRKDWDLPSINPKQFEASKGEFFRSLVATFNLIKQEQISPASVEALHPPIAKAFAHYSTHLKQNNLADFTDLLLLTRHHLSGSPDFKSKVKSRAQWLFVDEYQDVDPIQHDLMLSLSDGGKLCVIGDDDQAIYQFRGTDHRHFISLTKPAPGREVITLGTNFRCRANILANAIGIITKASGRIEKQMGASKPGGRVLKQRFDTLAQEAQFIASEIHALKSAGAVKKYSEIAILLRSVSSHARHYITELQRNAIPFRTRGDGSLFENPAVSLICRVLEFIAQEDTDIKHLQILGQPYLIPTARQDWTDLTDRDWAGAGLAPEQLAAFRRWETVRARYMGRKFTSLLELVLEIVGSLSILGSPSEPLVSPNIGALTQIVQEFDQVTQTKNLFFLCGFLAMHSGGIADQVFAPDSEDAVSLLTVHQSKGLQFSAVFTPMLCQGRFPSEKDDTRILIHPSLYDFARYSSSLDEERRLFYVAATRASDRLYATCATNVGLVKPKSPSIFFDETQHLDSPTCQLSIKSTDALDLPLSTSYSSLELYLSCPYRYKLSKTYGLTTPPNPFFEFGRVLHLVLRQVHEQFMAGVTVADKEVEQMYDRSFRLRLYVPKVTIDMRRAAGLKAIKNYIAQKKDWLARTFTVEKEFNYVLKRSILSGRYDLILRNGQFEIVDFKTGKPHDYINTDFQLGLYSLVANEYLKLNVKRAITCYVEHGIEAEYTIDASRLAEVKEKYQATVTAIRNQEFLATPGAVCVRCEFRKMCPFKA